MDEASWHWNVRLFDAVHATPSSPAATVELARMLTELPLLAALAVALWWIYRDRSPALAIRFLLAFAGVFAIEALVRACAFQPRPFASGFGPAWVSHAANNAMPSTHVALTWAAAGVLALARHRVSAILLFLFGAAMAWARVYVAIHWPADMAAALASACASAILAWALVRAGGLAWRLRARPS